MTRPKGAFVAYEDHLGPGKGGVQKCTREFLEVLTAAGLDLDIFPVKPDRRLATRLGRKLNPSKYWRPIDRNELKQLHAATGRYDFLFLNQVSLAGALPSFDKNGCLPSVILLSHGCEITDLMHLARLATTLPLSSRQLGLNSRLALGLTLYDEFKSRSRVDGVICISPFDADTEAWLGTRCVTWIPRTTQSAPLARAPVFGRFGFVGTLDHAPNLEGLVAVLEELQSAKADDLSIRIIGSPQRIGKWLADAFTNATYLGELDDEALAQDAQTWEAFLNPIFCLARGCSTKLADPISWSMPIVTSPIGRRGYFWKAGRLIEAQDPPAFVAAMKRFADGAFRFSAERGVREVAETSPCVKELGVQIAEFLEETTTRKIS